MLLHMTFITLVIIDDVLACMLYVSQQKVPMKSGSPVNKAFGVACMLRCLSRV